MGGQVGEWSLDVCSIQSWCFVIPLNIIFSKELLNLVSTHFPMRSEVNFVSDQSYVDLLVGVHLYIIHPFSEVLETIDAWQIKDKE